MLKESWSVILGCAGAVMAMLLTAVQMQLAELSGGVLRKLEATDPELAAQFEGWLRRRPQHRVTIRILLVLDLMLVALCIASWFHGTDIRVGILRGLVGPVSATLAIYFLATEWLGCDLSRLGSRHLLRLAMPLVRAGGVLFWPVVLPVCRWHAYIERRRESGAGEETLATTEDEIMSLIEKDGELEDNGDGATLEADERRMIKGIFDLDETLVREIMTPRVDLDALAETASIDEVKATIVESGHTRIPVYRGSIDQVLGLLHAKDLLDEAKLLGHSALHELLHTVIFIPETKNIGDLLAEFQQNTTHFAVVVDEYGGTAGIVTLEDILEEIVGEIHDEYDRDQETPPPVRLPDGSIMLDARSPICDLNETFGLGIPEDEDFDTLGGYVSFALGHIPKKGEKLLDKHLEIEVLEADRRRVLKARLVQLGPLAGNGEKTA